MAGLLKTLIRPDHEDDPEHARIAQAANILQIGEFQFLQLSYREWFGDDIPESAMDSLFKLYMLNGEVPFWARDYARRILRLDDTGGLNDSDPRYHRFDCEYSPRTPLDARRIGFMLGLAVMLIGGGIAISNFEAGPNVSMFPPYFSDAELRPEPRI